MLVRRCAKPDRKEFTKHIVATSMGFLVMGFIGFFVKVLSQSRLPLGFSVRRLLGGFSVRPFLGGFSVRPFSALASWFSYVQSEWAREADCECLCGREVSDHTVCVSTYSKDCACESVIYSYLCHNTVRTVCARVLFIRTQFSNRYTAVDSLSRGFVTFSL